MENDLNQSCWREVPILDYIHEANKIRIIWIGNFIRNTDVVENIFHITKTKARELSISNSGEWRAFTSDSCFSLHVIPKGDWKNLNGKKESFLDWMHSQVSNQDSTLFKFDIKKFKDNRIITTSDIVKKKRLIIDGLHRAFALQKACDEGIETPELKILDCYGSKIDAIFPCDIHQL